MLRTNRGEETHEVVHPSAAHESESNRKSTAYASAEVDIDVMKESSDVFVPPMDSASRRVGPLTTRRPFAKSRMITDGIKKKRIAKILLDIAKESAVWFSPLGSALGGVGALVKHYEVLVERITVVRN